MNVIRAMMTVGVFATATGAAAVDGMSLEVGRSDSHDTSVDLGRIGLQWSWNKRWSLGPAWHLGGFWDVGFGYWSNASAGRTVGSITEFGVSPVFRLQQTHPSGIAPYVQAAVGVHLLSDTSLGPQRRLSTMVQFADHVGLGIRFGPKQAFDLGYRYQHLSNGGIKRPNQGVNFHLVRLQHNF